MLEDDEERTSIKVLQLLGRRVDRWKSLRIELTSCGVKLTRVLVRLLGGLAKNVVLVDVSGYGTHFGTSADIGQDLQPPPQTLMVVSRCWARGSSIHPYHLLRCSSLSLENNPKCQNPYMAHRARQTEDSGYRL